MSDLYGGADADRTRDLESAIKDGEKLRTEAEDITLYSLRHTAASVLLARGVHVEAVSERLGHASTAFTMDTYVQSLLTVQEQAAA
ncbi:MAG: tyrosine-type recombinase/integrase [Acidobacteriia bacterium]|nr:tyrosine-type recombinase/integrase [Terriglobia bacterium]